jgi:hypothetical protein
MKSALILFITTAFGLVSGLPTTGATPGNVVSSSSITDIINPEPAPGSNDMTLTYTDGTIVVKKYGECFAFVEDNGKVLESTIFSTNVFCDIYFDTNCNGPSFLGRAPLPGKKKLPNFFNLPSKIVSAYTCKPTKEQSPIDVANDVKQLGLSKRS